MSGSLGTLLLYLIVATVPRSDCGTFSPKEGSSTTVRLVAQRNDTGSWTMSFGDYQMTIEHRHFDTRKSNPNGDSTWRMKVKHTSTVYQEADDDDDEDDDSYRGSEALNELSETINDINNSTDDVFIASVPDSSSSTTEEPFISGVLVVAEPDNQVKSEILQEREESYDSYDKTDYNKSDSIDNSDKEIDSTGNNDKEIDSTDISDKEIDSVDNNDKEIYSTDNSDREIDSTDNNDTEIDATDSNAMTSTEQETLNVDEERRITMDRFPRSRTLIHNDLEQEYNYKGYQYYSGVGYVKLNTAHWQWPDARKGCEAEGGHLAIPDNKYKMSLFMKILNNNTNIIGRAVLKNQVFIGVYDPERNRRLTTVLGEPFNPDISVWFPNEPNNADPGEDCVTLHLVGKLRDVPCFYNLPFLCQIDV